MAVACIDLSPFSIRGVMISSVRLAAPRSIEPAGGHPAVFLPR